MKLWGTELACLRGGREVFSDLTFTVAAGHALLVLGPNGIGKSSLLRLAAGLLRPTRGELSLEGGDPELSIGEQAHYLGHQDALKGALTVRENLQFWADFLGGGGLCVGIALDRMGLGEISGIPAAYLSAGQRRRLSIARLVAVSRPIWLLDEPTSALDTAGQEVLATVMREHLAGGGIILAATHGPIGLDNTRELQLGRET